MDGNGIFLVKIFIDIFLFCFVFCMFLFVEDVGDFKFVVVNGRGEVVEWLDVVFVFSFWMVWVVYYFEGWLVFG